MRISNFDRESAEKRVDDEIRAVVSKIHREITRPGETCCVDCGEEIEAQRRQAMPSAIRCVVCQKKHERK